MRRIGSRTSLGACILGALLSCGPPSGNTTAFVRDSLVERAPEVVVAAREEHTWKRSLEPRGLTEVRRFDRPRRRVRGKLASPDIDVIRQRPGSVLRWDVDLGEEPYLELTPLDCLPKPCPSLRFRVSVEDRSGRHRIVEARPGQTITSPTTIQASLERWSGRSVTLLFEMEGGVGVPWGRWGDPAVCSRRTVPAPTPLDDRLNVVLLGLDTLRADALGAYGRSPSPSPALDRLAREGELWEHAFATINNTNPSFASIFTGLYPKNHGIYDLSTPLPDEHVTLAERFSEAGYSTLAVLGAKHLEDRSSGLGQGFDLMTTPNRHRGSAEHVVHVAGQWIGTHRDLPFFAWLHFFDAHTPHVPPTPWAAGLGLARSHRLEPPSDWIWIRHSPRIPRRHAVPRLAGEPELYLSEVGYLDHQIDRFLGMLEGMGLLERTVVVVVGDHGENLGEHGLTASHAGLWDTTLRVPLLVRWPDGRHAGRRHSGLVQTLDLFPTLLDAAGLAAPSSDGVALSALAERGGRRAVFSEHADRLGVSVRTSTHRLNLMAQDLRIRGQKGVSAGGRLYDLRADPEEEVDLYPEASDVRTRLVGVLDAWSHETRPAAEPDSVELTEAERAELEALGYLE